MPAREPKTKRNHQPKRRASFIPLARTKLTNVEEIERKPGRIRAAKYQYFVKISVGGEISEARSRQVSGNSERNRARNNAIRNAIQRATDYSEDEDVPYTILDERIIYYRSLHRAPRTARAA